MKALILAAGVGSRLRPFTELRPKCLVDVHDQPILGHQLDALEGVGIDDITIVTGYRAGMIEDYVGGRDTGRYTLLHNPDYAQTGSMHTMMLARDAMAGNPFVLLNADLVFCAKMLGHLTNAAPATAALIDDRLPLYDGEMNVVIEEGRITRFSKAVPAAEAHAQSLQLMKFGAEDSALLFERAAVLAATKDLQMFPAHAYATIIERSAIYPVQAGDGFWHEVDTPEDLGSCARSYVERLEQAA
ncbi:MAG: phosphocholine cytidylyltransferase family protein [Natronohydrobacter sp.]|nr:phosphocholine cytidylyltransferase family protein [Natronohydrobacter sp.]